MSEAEWIDEEFESFQELEEMRAMILLNEDWKAMKKQGYLWRDINGKLYKAHNLKTRHLRNILRMCKTHYRPVEQITELQKLLEYREKSSKG